MVKVKLKQSQIFYLKIMLELRRKQFTFGGLEGANPKGAPTYDENLAKESQVQNLPMCPPPQTSSAPH